MITPLKLLMRPKLSMMNGAAAAGGYLIYPRPADIGEILALFFGIFLLAAGSSAINQVMERDLDRAMKRTMLRPIASGAISPFSALAAGIAAISSGILLLAAKGCFAAAVFGAAGAFWYLGAYTPLKRRTSLALPAGALCGSLPPVVGWLMAGGTFPDYRIIILAGIIFLWQMPHFWLLQRQEIEDYTSAGLPLCTLLKGKNPRLLLVLWSTAMITASLLLPLCSIVQPSFAIFCAMLLALLLISFPLRSDIILKICLNHFPMLLTLAIWI